MPIQTVALAVDEKEKAIKSSRGRTQSWWRPLWAWETRVECRWHDNVAWKQNEEKDTWRPEMTTNVTETSSEVLPSKVPSLGVFIQNQNQIFLTLPLICYQLLPLFFSEFKSESDDSECYFSSVFMNLDICVFLPYICILLNKLADYYFLSIFKTESIVMQAIQV